MKNFKPIDKKEINELVKEIGCGNEDAFNLLYTRMKKFLYYFLLKEKANKDAIEDIIASTFLVVIKKSKTKMFYKNCFSWIISIAKFELISYNRKNNKLVYDSETIDRCGTRTNLNSLSLKNEIEKLDVESQQILYFIFYAKLTYNEISHILNISISTVKRRKNEILNHFKEMYYNEEK